MGDKIIKACSKLDKSWTIGIIAILLVLGMVTGFIMGIVPVSLFEKLTFLVVGWLMPNGLSTKKAERPKDGE